MRMVPAVVNYLVQDACRHAAGTPVSDVCIICLVFTGDLYGFTSKEGRSPKTRRCRTTPWRFANSKTASSHGIGARGAVPDEDGQSLDHVACRTGGCLRTPTGKLCLVSLSSAAHCFSF